MPRPARILLVEDDSDLAACLEVVLAEAGYLVDLVSDGPSALAACVRQPALVLVDFYLPGTLSGGELVRALRKTCRLGTRIIIMSGLRESAETRQAGADGYLEKPFDIDFLLETLRHHLMPPPDDTPSPS
ncbi:MAG TPA: response regulator [Polyangia bacterium]|jgi:DNA-binding response OmpR family regulator|nr:response regulator [Polyangia bacterium]